MFENNIKIIIEDLYKYSKIDKTLIIKENISKRLDKSFKNYVKDLSDTYKYLDLNLNKKAH